MSRAISRPEKYLGNLELKASGHDNPTHYVYRCWLASKLFVMSQTMLIGSPFQIRRSMCTEKIYTFIQENSLVMSNSAHTSLCRVKLKRSTLGTRRETHFWPEGDLNIPLLVMCVCLSCVLIFVCHPLFTFSFVGVFDFRL